MWDEVVPFGERYSAAEYREWIRAQLSDREQLMFSRAVLDLTSARWRILGKEGFVVITDQRMFIVHADAAYSGRTRRPRFPHEWQIGAVPPPKIAREAARKDLVLLPRSPDDRVVTVWIKGVPQRFRFRKAADALDFEKSTAATDEGRSASPRSRRQARRVTRRFLAHREAWRRGD